MSIKIAIFSKPKWEKKSYSLQKGSLPDYGKKAEPKRITHLPNSKLLTEKTENQTKFSANIYYTISDSKI